MNVAADKAGDHPGQPRGKVLSVEDDSYAGRDPFVQDAVAALWREKRTMFASLCVALVVSGVALVLIPPRYTGEAIIRLNFGSQETSGAAAKEQKVATPDPAALVESAARIVGSRAAASAVVDQLGLDRDPRFAHESTLSRSYMAARSALGLQRALSPSSHELAVATLLSRIAVTNEPRSYLITINATAEDPKRAADLANALGLEYMRGEVVQRLNEAQAAAERDLDELAATYGKRHPNYLRAQDRVAQVRADLEAVQKNGDLTASLNSQIGSSFIPADVVAVPSSPNPRTIIGLGALAGLALGAWLSLRRASASADEIRDELDAEPAKPHGSRGAAPR